MLCWGSAYVPSARLIDDLPPLAAAAARLGLAGALLIGVVAATGRSIRPGVGWGTVAWLGLTQTAVFYGTTFWGIASEGAGIAAVLANTDPLFVAALSAVLLGEHLDARQWAGLGVGFLGVGIAVSRVGAWPPQISPAALVVVAGALAWGIGTITAAKGVRGSASPLALAGHQMLLGAAMLAAAAALRGGEVHVGTGTIGLVVLVAVVGSAAPLAMFYLALVSGAAGEVSAWFFMVPIVGVLTAWPVLGETPSMRVLVGMLGVSVGLWLVLARANRQRLVPSPPEP